MLYILFHRYVSNHFAITNFLLIRHAISISLTMSSSSPKHLESNRLILEELMSKWTLLVLNELISGPNAIQRTATCHAGYHSESTDTNFAENRSQWIYYS